MSKLRNLAAVLGLVLASPAWATTYFVAGTGGVTTGNDANACTAWDAPCLTVAGALGKATPTIIAADKTGSYVATGAITWTMPGTAITIVSATNAATGTAITQSSGATESIGNATAAFTVAGVAGTNLTVIGMHLVSTTNASGNGVTINTGTSAEYMNFEGCTFEFAGTGIANSLTIVNTNYLRLYNQTLLVSGSRAGQIVLFSGSGTIDIISPTISMTGGTKPTSLFGSTAGVRPTVTVRDGDISGFSTAASALVSINAFPAGEILFKNLKLSATPTLTTGSYPAGATARIILRNVDSGNTLYTFQVHDATGDLTEDASNYLTAATTFNAVPYSWKIVTTSLANPNRPFRVPIIEQWNTNTGSQTLNVEFAQNSAATALTDQDIWSSQDYANSASFPSYSIGSNRNAQPITGTPANQTTSTAGWTGLTSPTKQKLANTFTAAAVGTIQGVVNVGVASATVYLNPGLTP